LSTPTRKLDHLIIARDREVESRGLNWLPQVHLPHEALPEMDLDEVDLEVEFLGRTLSAPILIEAMTGGHEAAREINRALASVAQEFRVVMGVGSQRAALEHPELAETYRVARREAPDIPLIANIGATHVTGDSGLRSVQEVASMIGADAVAVHLNALQEVVQPEGDPEYAAVLPALRDLVSEAGVPIIVKETGTGISGQTARALERAGVYAIDVGGAGGTHWAIVEGMRYPEGHRLAPSPFVFASWGIPTPATVAEVSALTSRVRVIGSGGIRSGVDAAKVIALGAHMAGAALPFLRAFYRGGRASIRDAVERLITELRWALFLTGCRTPAELRLRAGPVVTGNLLQWLQQRLGHGWQVYKPGTKSPRWLVGWG